MAKIQWVYDEDCYPIATGGRSKKELDLSTMTVNTRSYVNDFLRNTLPSNFGFAREHNVCTMQVEVTVYKAGSGNTRPQKLLSFIETERGGIPKEALLQIQAIMALEK